MKDFTTSTILLSIVTGIMEILTPFIFVLSILILLYTLFTACSEKFFSQESRNIKFGKLLAGGFSKSLTIIIEKLPSIIMIGTAITMISLISSFFNKTYQIWEQQQRIKELNTYVKNLTNADDIAFIKVKERRMLGSEIYSIYQIEVLDNITGEIISDEEIRLSGRELKFDSMVVNFEYSEIETGKEKNIAFPYRVFSEKLAPDNGIKLKTIFTMDSSLDELLELEASQAYGLSKDIFIKRAKEFIQIVKDPIKSREMGIKSSYGETLTIPRNAHPGDEFIVRITGVGGLTLVQIQ